MRFLFRFIPVVLIEIIHIGPLNDHYMNPTCVCTFQVQLSQEELQRIITEAKEELGYVVMFFFLFFHLSSNCSNVTLVIVIF